MIMDTAQPQTQSPKLLSPTVKYGGSLFDVTKAVSSEEAYHEFKEKPGLLRRAFSSKKRRRKPSVKLETDNEGGHQMDSHALSLSPKNLLRLAKSHDLIDSMSGCFESFVIDTK